MKNENSEKITKQPIQPENSLNKEEEEKLYKKKIADYLNSRSGGGDLKYLLKEFSEKQKEALMNERQEEEKQCLNQIFYSSPKVN